MSLSIAIEIPKITKTEAQSIFNRINSTNLVTFAWHPGNYEHFEITPGHDLLTDEADWNADFWDFQSNMLPYLAQAVDRFGEVYSGPFRFSALWISDKPNVTIKVSPSELSSLIRANRIGTKTVYLVNERAI